MVKFSFIIPVYKSEKYLPECIDSILRQTYKDYEVILVDDGSPDRSGALCDEYAEQYPEIHALHKKNGGASSARNLGVKKAQGEYIIFLDSDDYWDSDEGLHKINNLLSPEVDVVVFASKNLYEDAEGNVIQIKDDRYNYPEVMNRLSGIDTLEFMVSHDLFNMHSSKKVYRKEFFEKNNLYFIEGIRAEDIEQGFRVANCLPVYRFLNEKLYVYRQHGGSVTAIADEKHLLEHYGILKKYADFEYRDDRVRNCLYSYLAYQFALLSALITNARVTNKRQIFHEMRTYQYLFQYDMYPRTKTIGRVMKYVGFNVTRLLLSLYLKVR